MNSKKGATLAELIIVMAIVAVIGVMVTSFSIAVHRQINLGTARYDVLETKNLLTDRLSSFIENYDRPDCSFSAQNGILTVTRTVTGSSAAQETYQAQYVAGDSTSNSHFDYTIFDIDGYNEHLADKNAYNALSEKSSATDPGTANAADYTVSGSISLNDIENISFYTEQNDDNGSFLIIMRIYYYMDEVYGSKHNKEGCFYFTYTTKATKKATTE